MGSGIEADMVTPVGSSSSRSARSAAGVAFGAVITVGVTACVPPSGPPQKAESPAAAPLASSPASSGPATSASADVRLTAPASARVAATCENIMDPSSDTTVVPWVLPEGAIQLPPLPVLAQGANCVASDDSDDSYDWSPASRSEWDALVAEYTADDSGWFTEDGPRGTYLTYKLDGRYAQTFLFTGDAVILAPTKAATDAVIGPPLA